MIDVDLSALQLTLDQLRNKTGSFLDLLQKSEECIKEMRFPSSGQENTLSSVKKQLEAVGDAFNKISACVDVLESVLQYLAHAEKQTDILLGEPFDGIILQMKTISLAYLKNNMQDVKFALKEDSHE